VKVVLLALGSRGDVQPMVSLGKALQSAGKPVMVVALREFAPLVEAAGLLFMPIDATFEDTGPAAAETARKMAGGGMSYQRPSALGLPTSRPRSPSPRWRRSNRATSSSAGCCRSTTP
jgi:UDP:flavonoid glycosyltransferase YjiC (YdhE family)